MTQFGSLTDDQLDEMTQEQRITYFKSLNLGHNAAIRIGIAPNRGQRAFEIHLAVGERAAAMSGELNEVTRELDGARDDLVAERHRREQGVL